MDDAVVIGVILCGVIIGLAVGTLIAGVVFRTAVRLYNTFVGGAGSPTRVALPSLRKSMGIVLVTAIINTIITIFVGVLVRGAGTGSESQGLNFAIKAQLVSLPIGALNMAGLLTMMLPTTFGRAIAITICNFVLTIPIGIVLVAAIAGIVAVVGR